MGILKFAGFLLLPQAATSYGVPSSKITRRRLLTGGVSFGTFGTFVAVAAPEPAAAARDLLEYMRILSQEAADNVKYDGELAPVNGQPPSPAALLVPITRIDALLKEVRGAIDEPSNWDELRKVLSSPPMSKKEFKQVFNAFADNIYYAVGSERANAYLGGGATPTTQQTTQYLLRNEILSDVETAVQELDYLIRVRDKGEVSRVALVGEELDDLRGLLDKAIAVMTQYRDIADKGDLDLANAARLKREEREWFIESP